MNISMPCSDILLGANQSNLFSFDPLSGKLCYRPIYSTDHFPLLTLAASREGKTRATSTTATSVEDSFVEIKVNGNNTKGDLINRIQTDLLGCDLSMCVSELFLLVLGIRKHHPKSVSLALPSSSETATLYVFSLHAQSWFSVALPEHCRFRWFRFYPFEDSHAMFLTEDGLIYELDLTMLDKEASLDYKWNMLTYCSLQGLVPAYTRTVDAMFISNEFGDERDREWGDFRFGSMLVLLETGVVLGLCPIPGARSYPLSLQETFYKVLGQVSIQPEQLIMRHIVREGTLNVPRKRIVLNQGESASLPLNGLHIAAQGPFKICPEPSLDTATRPKRLLCSPLFGGLSFLVAVLYEESEWLELFVMLDMPEPHFTLPTLVHGRDMNNQDSSSVLYLIATLHFEAPIIDMAIDASQFWVVDKQGHCYEGSIKLKDFDTKGNHGEPLFECECHVIKMLPASIPSQVIITRGETESVHFGTQFTHYPGLDAVDGHEKRTLVDAQFDAMHKALIADKALLDEGVKFKALQMPHSKATSSLPPLPQELIKGDGSAPPTAAVFSDSSLPLDEHSLVQASQYLCTHLLPITRELSRQFKSIIEHRAELLTRAALRCQSMIQRMDKAILDKHREPNGHAFLNKVKHMTDELRRMEEWCDVAEEKLLFKDRDSRNVMAIASRIQVLNRILKAMDR